MGGYFLNRFPLPKEMFNRRRYRPVPHPCVDRCLKLQLVRGYETWAHLRPGSAPACLWREGDDNEPTTLRKFARGVLQSADSAPPGCNFSPREIPLRLRSVKTQIENVDASLDVSGRHIDDGGNDRGQREREGVREKESTNTKERQNERARLAIYNV